MKKWLNILALLLGSGVILATWLVLPGRLLERQRQKVFCSNVAVAIENVHPYGEESIHIRRKLEQAIMRLAGEKYKMVDVRSDEGYEETAREVAMHFQEFLDCWNEDVVPYLWKEGIVLEDYVSLCISEKETCELARINFVLMDNAGNKRYLGFAIEPTTGIPISGSMLLEMDALGMTADELFYGLADACAQSLGIPFHESTRWDVQDENKYNYDSDATVEMAVDDESEDISRVYQAESADGSYHLMTVFDWISSKEQMITFELWVN